MAASSFCAMVPSWRLSAERLETLLVNQDAQSFNSNRSFVACLPCHLWGLRPGKRVSRKKTVAELFNEQDHVMWISHDVTLTLQPAASILQQTADCSFAHLPIEDEL